MKYPDVNSSYCQTLSNMFVKYQSWTLAIHHIQVNAAERTYKIATLLHERI